MADKGQTVSPDLEDGELDDAPVGGGTFSQEQVNAIVRDRLARQRRRLETQGQGSKADLEKLQGELTAATERLKRYDDRAKASLDEKRKGLPEGVLQLLDKLAPDDQLSWIEANAEKLTPVPQPKDTGPQTPQPKAPVASQPDLSKKTSGSGIYYGI